jgi:hypothetical protein
VRRDPRFVGAMNSCNHVVNKGESSINSVDYDTFSIPWYSLLILFAVSHRREASYNLIVNNRG